MIVQIALGGAIVMSLVSAAALAWDKRQARWGRWRVSEATLHVLELLGGWPGSWLAQVVFRHKTRKRSYRVMFWLCTLANIAGVGAGAWVLYRLPL